MRLTRPRLRALVMCLLAVLSWSPAQAQPTRNPGQRVQVGLALGGGSARGLAHVGVLLWFEEHRIPVDVLAGTSMGSLVGAAYATGRSAKEVNAFLDDVDWDLMFLGDIPFDSKVFRRKEDRRAYPVLFELGLRDGLGVAGGLDPGHQVGLVLSRLTFPYPAPLDFDSLPIPFRAVATDIEEAQVVVLRDGSLARALRASLAIPAVFTPVLIDDHLLVDGGVLNNVPVDVTIEMGAEVVIAVDVGAPLRDRSELGSPIGLASQALDVMMTERTRVSLERADIVIVPELDDFSSTDWRRSDELIALGYAAADTASASLLPLALESEEWRRHQSDRMARRLSGSPVVSFVTVDGVASGRGRDVFERASQQVGQPIRVPELEQLLTSLAGAGRYQSLMYEVAVDGSRRGLRIYADEKSYGPPFINLAMDLANRDDVVEFGLGARVTAHDGTPAAAETRADLFLGSDIGAGVEYYRPLWGGPLFVAPSAEYAARTRRFLEDQAPVATYRVKRTAVGVDAGVSLGERGEVRVGYELARADVDLQIGDPVLPELDGREQVARMSWVYDGQDHWIVPTRGTRVRTTFSYLFESPDPVTELSQLEIRTSSFFPLSPMGRLMVSFFGGTSFDGEPGALQRFTLGGPLQLSAFDIDQFSGDHVLQATAAYFRQIGRLPDFVGGPIYFLGGVETGTAFDDLDTASVQTDVVAGFVLETVVGGVFVTGSVGVSGDTAFYFGVGREL